ncbi:UAA transporter [Exidia glandulosa HHB12029]|uniref:UAA transporter n=1 Tax=Exidia glandulosa HHB12029 TaxID=1314781 RepID=A0A166BD19_EXIGL|nr:UAA transporter [Exidia glandulosa HHB12029]
MPLTLLFGGCCSNAWSLEQLLTMDPRIASALTVIQMLFIAAHSLPVVLGADGRLKPRNVPLRKWALQVLCLVAMSLLNNWVFLFHVPVTVQIVFRSAGLLVSMAFNSIFNGKRYSALQITSVAVVSVGVVLATLSRPASAKGTVVADTRSYFIGIMMLSLSLVMSSTLGLLQERTFAVHGPHWREGLFYTHLMSIPVFMILPESRRSIQAIRAYDLQTILPLVISNTLTQSLCVAGVNQLMSRVSSVSTNIALTTRKALSLCLSVWWFGSGWNTQLGLGASLVGIGTLVYAYASQAPKAEKIKKE